MNIFDFQRFLRVIGNDLLLLNARRVAMVTLGLVGIGLLYYAPNMRAAIEPGAEPLSQVLFPMLLIGGGMIFTSMIYGDMHHPLERFHYLTLPVSNLERFVSRYLITAPLFYVYAVVFYYIFELLAAGILGLWWDRELTFARLDLGSELIGRVSLLYFAAHAVMYTGAIYFRSYALIRTGASLFALWACCGVLGAVTIRLLYWDSFQSFFELKPEAIGNMNIMLPEFLNFENGWTLLHKTILTAFFAWVLFLGYLGLRHHEVQDGL